MHIVDGEGSGQSSGWWDEGGRMRARDDFALTSFLSVVIR